MPEIWEIESVATQETERGLSYGVALVRPDGKRVLHVFDDEVLESRAAEYGIDPTDLDAIIDVVLHEPHMPDFSDPRNAERDPAAQAGKTSPATRSWGRLVSIGDMVPTTVANAASLQEAREAHLIRVDHIKNNVLTFRSQKGKSDPLKVIKDNAQIDPERVREKREYMSRVRGPRVALAREKSTARRSTAQILPFRRPVPASPTQLPHDDARDKKDPESDENDSQ